MVFKNLNLFQFAGADFAENKKENSVFANIVNLPPTEEVSDNELENIDDFNEENEKSNLENQSRDHNDIASSTLNSQFDHNNHRNTFSHQKEYKYRTRFKFCRGEKLCLKTGITLL